MPIGDEQWVQDQINAQLQQQPVVLPTMRRGSPDDGSSQGWLGHGLGLLGEALGGGQSPGYQLRGREEGAAGSKALLNFGINMLLASGPQRTRPDLLSAAASGLQGAQQSIAVDQQAAQQAAQADYAQQLGVAKFGQQQQQNKIESLKAVIPLLQLQQKNRELAGLKGTPGTTTATPAGDGTYEGTTIATEGSGKNPRSSAAGGGQFIDLTWSAFVKANPEHFAGMTPEQAMAARLDPVLGPKLAPIATRWLATQNAPTLTAAGVEPTGPNLRTAHAIGAKPAAAIIQAPPNTPIAQVLATVMPPADVERVLKANPTWAPMTAGQFTAQYAGTPNPTFLGKPAVGTKTAGGSPGVVTTPATTPATTPPATTPPATTPAPATPAAAPAAPGFTFVPPTGPAYSPTLPPDLLATYQRRMQMAASPEEYHKAAQELATAQQKQAQDSATLLATERDRQQKDWAAQSRPASDAELAAHKVEREQGVTYTIDNNGKLAMNATPLDPRLVQQAESDQKSFQTNYADKYHSIVKMRPILNEMELLLHRVEADPKSGSGGIGAEYARKANGLLVSLGLASPQLTESHGAQEAYSALANSLTLAMKSGISMGSVSDRDLAFLEANTPGLSTSPAGRRLLMGGLRQMWDYQERLYDLAAETIRQRPHTLAGFSDKVRNLPDAIPLAPDPSSSPAALTAWKEKYKPRVGQTVYRSHDGTMKVWGQG